MGSKSYKVEDLAVNDEVKEDEEVMSKRSHIKAKISGFVSGIFSKKEEPV